MKQLMKYRIISGQHIEERTAHIDLTGAGQPRGRKTGKSPASQLARNEAQAVRTLAREFHCNCGHDWQFLTLNYEKGAVPRSAREGGQRIKNFIRRLSRAYRKQQGEKLVYFWSNGEYNTKTGEPCPLHHHFLLPYIPLEVIADNWPDGPVTARSMEGGADYFELARYLIRNAGYGKGRRAWKSSLGNKKPVRTSPVPVNQLADACREAEQENQERRPNHGKRASGAVPEDTAGV